MIKNDQKQPIILKNTKKMIQNNSRRPKTTKNDAKKQSVTDGQTDRQTDRPTNGPADREGYRVACTKKVVVLGILSTFFFTSHSHIWPFKLAKILDSC